MSQSAQPGQSELKQRVISAVIMVIGALVLAWLGGWAFAGFWFVLALAAAYEWAKVIGAQAPMLLAGASGASLLAFAAIFVGRINAEAATLVGIAGVAAAAYSAGAGRRIWGAAAVPYTGALFLGSILVRGVHLHETQDGLLALLFLYVAVWATDIAAYFTGRRFGGPKFAPRISPKKTWSGVIGGVLCGTVLACAVLFFNGISVGMRHIALASALSIAVVFGDLFESFLKRRFGVKDAGALIPGHGGVLDRLDGYTFAAFLAALVGAAAAGWQNIAAGMVR